MSLPLHRSPDEGSRERFEGSTLNPRFGEYRDTLLPDHEDDSVDMEGVPPGTVPKDERHDMGPVWRGDEDDEHSSRLTTHT